MGLRTSQTHGKASNTRGNRWQQHGKRRTYNVIWPPLRCNKREDALEARQARAQSIICNMDCARRDMATTWQGHLVLTPNK
jgi:hypothetical protein